MLTRYIQAAMGKAHYDRTGEETIHHDQCDYQQNPKRRIGHNVRINSSGEDNQSARKSSLIVTHLTPLQGGPTPFRIPGGAPHFGCTIVIQTDAAQEGLPARPATRYHGYFLPLMTHSATARILKAVNALIVVLLAAALAATYWYAWRPLPQLSGSVEAPVAAPVSVSLDSLREAPDRESKR